MTLLIDPPCYNTGMTTTVNISQISALPGDTADIYTDTKKRYEEKTVLPGYLHLVVQNSIFTCLLSSSGQEWQFHMSTDILWPRHGNCTCLETFSGHAWQFYIATDM